MIDVGKLLIAAQMEEKTGSKPDSSVVETAYAEMTSVFASVNLEFNSTGKGIYSVILPSGELKKDTATYTVDYQKGILNNVSIEEGEQKKDTINIKFEGNYLTMINNEKKETVKLKRIK